MLSIHSIANSYVTSQWLAWFTDIYFPEFTIPRQLAASRKNADLIVTDNRLAPNALNGTSQLNRPARIVSQAT